MMLFLPDAAGFIDRIDPLNGDGGCYGNGDGDGEGDGNNYADGAGCGDGNYGSGDIIARCPKVTKPCLSQLYLVQEVLVCGRR